MTWSIPLPDPATRPKAPKIEGVTERQRSHGKRLALFHRMHLGEMAHVRAAMQRVLDGEAQRPDLAQELADQVSSMAMIANYRQFGNLCGGTCNMLTGHHSIEDEWIFPPLMDRSEGLNRVVARLAAEHEVIHEILVALYQAATALIREPGPQNGQALREIFEKLEGFVISHFGYEQEELEEALGYYNIEI
jgi:Hemerythrin HHE cation binding domain